MRTAIFILLLGAGLAGCGPRGLYHWGSYPSALNGYYRDPANQAAYREALQTAIAAEGGARVPPGLMAELGYLELAAGNSAEAKRLFEREKTAWPEAKPFMDRMIRRIDDGTGPSSAASPPTAAAPATPADAGAKPARAAAPTS